MEVCVPHQFHMT